MLQVLDAAMTYPAALPFTSPVSEEQAPGYRAVVKRPMDLGTLRNRVARGKCPNALAALSDIRLVRLCALSQIPPHPLTGPGRPQLPCLIDDGG